MQKLLDEERKKEKNNSKNNMNPYETLKAIKDSVSMMSEFQTLNTQFQIESLKEKSIQEEIRKDLKTIDKSQKKIVI